MKQTHWQFFPGLWLGTILLFLFSCANSWETPPFPENETQYKQPKVQKFAFTPEEKIEWETLDAKGLGRLPEKKFRWDKIEAKPFDIGVPYPLRKPLTTQPFDWNSLPSRDFSFDSLPRADLKIKVSVLGEPTIVKAGLPSRLPQSSRGVTYYDFDFGLPSTARAVLQDREGLIWIGTNNGFARYDSENLTIYGLEAGIGAGIVTNIYQDSQGRFWLGSNGGALTVVDFDNDLVYELSSLLPVGGIFELIEAEDGRLWCVANGAGYNIIDLEEESIWHFGVEQGLLNAFSLDMMQDRDGLIWCSTARGVNILDLKAGKNLMLSEEQGLLKNLTYNFFQDPSGRIWISGRGGITILDQYKSNLSHMTEEHGLDGMQGAADIMEDPTGGLWMGSENGLLFYFNEDEGMLTRFKINPTDSKYVYGMFKDASNQLWLAIGQGGLFSLNLDDGRPGNFTMQDGLGDNAVWSTLEAQDGKIWIGTYNGVDIYDPVSKTIKHLGTEQGLVGDRNSRLMEDSKGLIWASGGIEGVSIIDPEKETIRQLTSDRGLPTDIISGMVEYANGAYVLGGSEGEFIWVDLEHLELKMLQDNMDSSRAQINMMCKDSDNQIWTASLGDGLRKIDLNRNTSVTLTTTEGLASDVMLSVLPVDGDIWVATIKGVQLIDVHDRELTTFTTEEGLGASDVFAIIEHDGAIYSGTSQGLSILKPNFSASQDHPYWNVRTIGKRQGLDFVDFDENSFSFDKDGRFWAGVDAQILTVMDPISADTVLPLTTISGLNIFDKKENFHQYSGSPEHLLVADSTISSNVKTLLNESRSPQLDSDDLKRRGIAWKSVTSVHDLPVGLTLPYDQNYLSFSYHGAGFRNPENVVYRYFLEGIDKKWSPITENTTSENYRDLPDGAYTFKVASKRFDSGWGSAAEFHFTILPPWWKTWWAYLLFAVILGGLFWSIIQYRSKWLQKENKLLEEKVSHRTSQLREKIEELKSTQSQLIHSEKMASLGELTAGIAHEIQNPLNFVNNFSEINVELIDEMLEELAAGNQEDVVAISNDIRENQKKISHHGRRADGIVKGMLQHSRSSSKQKELTDINAIADEYFRLAYHGLRAKDKSFNAVLESSFDESIGKINVIPQDIGRVILNLITNAFYAVKEKKQKLTARHSEGIEVPDYQPTVWVSTSKVDGIVEVVVRDNGGGIPPSALEKIFQPFFTTKPTGEGTGLGLSLSYDIVKIHQGELLVETKEGEGTKFTIQIPI